MEISRRTFLKGSAAVAAVAAVAASPFRFARGGEIPRPHRDANITYLAACRKIKRADGVILGFTNHDNDICVDLDDGDGIITYKAAARWNRSSTRSTAELETDNFQSIAYLDDDRITVADVCSGRYDFAEIQAFWVDLADPSVGVLKVWRAQTGMFSSTGHNKTYISDLRGHAA